MSEVSVETDVAGSVWKIEVQPGAQVAEGDVLMILESMKMEIPVEAPVDGIVSRVAVELEAQVEEGDVVVVLSTA